MLFQRLKVMWLGFWAQLIGKGEQRHHMLVAQGAIAEQRRHLMTIRSALTNLIFHKKKLADQLATLDRDALEMRADIQSAARDNRDELALNLIARLESTQAEQTFVREQSATLERDVEIARTTERQLVQELGKGEQMIATLSSRHQALTIRRRLQNELQQVRRGVPASVTSLEQPLADQIRKLEAEMETLETKRESWEKDWEEVRQARTKGRHQQLLDQIKDGMRRPAVLVGGYDVSHS